MKKPAYPKYAIMNTCDAPCEYHVCELIDGKFYCYMARATRKNLREFDGMQPTRPTAIEDFGWKATKSDDTVFFDPIGPSVATYEDGKPRQWQGFEKRFELSCVKLTKKQKAVIYRWIEHKQGRRVVA